ncbi:MAG: zinc ribbon domain-containing protein [Candidatus Brockarchaeota archaeon]|nr:zinc ribbon domain-containing protein [Candidatus Brockarchaeota archaeon]
MQQPKAMTYCVKCGVKNSREAETCSRCGASLGAGRDPDPREDECFGLPHGGEIASVVFGLIIIIFGVSWLAGLDFWKLLFPLLLIIFGSLIILGSIYKSRRG